MTRPYLPAADRKTRRLPAASVPESIRRRADAVAEQLGIRVSELVRRAVVAWLDGREVHPQGREPGADAIRAWAHERKPGDLRPRFDTKPDHRPVLTALRAMGSRHRSPCVTCEHLDKWPPEDSLEVCPRADFVSTGHPEQCAGYEMAVPELDDATPAPRPGDEQASAVISPAAAPVSSSGQGAGGGDDSPPGTVADSATTGEGEEAP